MFESCFSPTHLLVNPVPSVTRVAGRVGAEGASGPADLVTIVVAR